MAIHPVHLSLAELVRQSNGWQSVAQLDAAAHLTLNKPQPVALPAIPASAAPVKSVSASTTSGGIADVSGNGARNTQRVLALVQSKAIGNIRRRLQRETDEMAHRFAAAQDLQVAQGVEQARQQAVEKYNASLQSLLTPIAARRISLNVQIAALTIDARPSNPPTAPDNYWRKLLASRQLALDALPLPQTIAQRAALDQISSQVNAAKSALQKGADSQVAAYRASLVQRNQQILARQSLSFAHEQSDLMAISGQLTTQLTEPVASSATGGAIKPFEPTIAAGAKSHGSAIASAGIAAAAETPSAAFADQRQRLIAQLTDSTRRSAEHAAAQLHYVIVDWNSRRPDTRASALIVAQMRLNMAQGA